MISVGAVIAESARRVLEEERLLNAHRQAERDRVYAQRAKEERLEHIQLLQSFLDYHQLAVMADEPFVPITADLSLEYAYPHDRLPQAAVVGKCPCCGATIRSDAFSTLARLGELLETFRPSQYHMSSEECWRRRPALCNSGA